MDRVEKVSSVVSRGTTYSGGVGTTQSDLARTLDLPAPDNDIGGQAGIIGGIGIGVSFGLVLLVGINHGSLAFAVGVFVAGFVVTVWLGRARGLHLARNLAVEKERVARLKETREQLLYFFRCGGLYAPGDTALTPPGQMLALLQRRAKSR